MSSGSEKTPGPPANQSPPSPESSNPPPSSESPPPPDTSSSGGKQGPPPPPTSSAPPPSGFSSFTSPPPSGSKSSPPTPLPPDSDSKSRVPESPSNFGSPPPTSSPGSNPATPPPPDSGGKNASPPPPSESPPSLSPPPPLTPATPAIEIPSPSPPQSTSHSSPPPSSSAPVVSPVEHSPPPLSTISPPAAKSSPDKPGSPPPKITRPPPPSRDSHRENSKSPPPPHSSSSSKTGGSSSNSKGGSSSPPGSIETSGTLIGVTIAGVFIVLLVAVLLVTSMRRTKRRKKPYGPPYMAPNTVSVRSDAYYYKNQHTMGNNGVEAYHNPSSGSSFGSQRGGNLYHGGGPDSGGIGAAKSFFSYEDVMEITNGFSHENVLGEGGFGCVYKGWLPDGKLVAVKQLKAGSGQGEREFRAEVEIISRVHHRHLVSLVGYCISENQRLLLYEFVPNKTLEHHLHGKGMSVLEWTKRMKIAVGAAKGLAYLHEDCHPKIIHRDIKSANILLDDSFEAQVADFGLAKLANDTNTHVSTRVMGTFGYLAPEYASSGKLTDRSDVFSFGVVLLELVTGRKPVDPYQPLGDESLVEWARPHLIHALETGDISELVDPRLEKHYVESEMLQMIEAAAACIRHSAPKRPRMAQVVRALDSEGEMSDLSNGVKYGQSTIYNSGQYNHEISRFRRMALGSGGTEYDANSGDYNTKELSGSSYDWKLPDGSSGESETRAFTRHSSRSSQHKFGNTLGGGLGGTRF